MAKPSEPQAAAPPRRTAAGRLIGATWQRLDEPNVVVALILGYCLVHFLVRLSLSPVYSIDEAEQVLFAQELSWGYRFRHPPLITWMVWAVQEVFGVTRPALFALKYMIMAGGFVALFYAGKAILRETRLAALATAAFTLTYTVGYYPHLDLMHTVLLTALLGAGLWSLTQVIEHGRWRDYLLYGLITALGILSKYVYGIFALGAVIAVFAVPMIRARIAPARALASLALTLLLLAPYGAWVLSYDYSMVDLAQTMTEAETGGVDPAGWARGTGMLAFSLLEFTLPFSLIFIALFWPSLRPGPDRAASDLADLRTGYLRLLEIVMIAGALMMLAAVFFGGATHFKGRWMHQVLMGLPIYLFLRASLSPVPPSLPRLKVYGGLVAATALLVVAARIVSYDMNIKSCSKCWEYQPFADYADDLRQHGFIDGTILVNNMYLGGNLRAQFPDARVLIHGYPLSIFPKTQSAQNAGSCLIAWMNDKPSVPDKLGPLRAKLGLDPLPDDHERGRVRRRIDPDNDRWFTLSYAFLRDGAGDCR